MTVFTIWPDDVEWRRVSPKLLLLELLSYVTTLAVIAAITLAVWLIFDFWPALLAGGAIAALMLIRLVFLPRNLRSWGYAERADDLLVRHGDRKSVV